MNQRPPAGQRPVHRVRKGDIQRRHDVCLTVRAEPQALIGDILVDVCYDGGGDQFAADHALEMWTEQISD